MREKKEPIKTYHKEESHARIVSDEIDQENLRNFLKTCIHPLDVDSHHNKTSLSNIYTGQHATKAANVNKSVQLGSKQMKEFEAVLPQHFHTTIQKTLVTMKEMEKKVKTGNVVYNIEVVYSRVMCLLNAKQIDLKDLFKYELSPVPLTLFDENGDSRVAKQKANLKNTLKEKVSLRKCLSENAVVLYSCALLWSVHWPKAGNVSNLVNVFKDYVMKFLHKSNVFSIFDRYHDCSIKGVTHQDRVGNARRSHNLSLSTPLPSKEVTLHSTETKKQLIECC